MLGLQTTASFKSPYPLSQFYELYFQLAMASRRAALSGNTSLIAT